MATLVARGVWLSKGEPALVPLRHCRITKENPTPTSGPCRSTGAARRQPLSSSHAHKPGEPEKEEEERGGRRWGT